MAENTLEMTDKLTIRYDDQGLVPAIVQDVDSGQVLMLAWQNEQALQLTLETRQATFYSRSRHKIWVKGEISGHVQEVIEARVDCDQDAVLLRCKSQGPACHVGYHSCFYRCADPVRLKFVEARIFDPHEVYEKQ